MAVTEQQPGIKAAANRCVFKIEAAGVVGRRQRAGKERVDGCKRAGLRRVGEHTSVGVVQYRVVAKNLVKVERAAEIRRRRHRHLVELSAGGAARLELDHATGALRQRTRDAERADRIAATGPQDPVIGQCTRGANVDGARAGDQTGIVEIGVAG